MRDGEEWLDAEDIKYILLEMCVEAGVDLLYHTLAVDAIVAPPEANARAPLPR